jgi:hypothetical protein
VWRILQDHGYVKTQSDLSKILRIGDKNVSRYLLPPGHKHRISPRIDTLAGWCWAISQTTGLGLRLVIDSSAEVSIGVSGYKSNGEPVEDQVIHTSYRETDMVPLQSWVEEWLKFLKKYKSFYTV